MFRDLLKDIRSSWLGPGCGKPRCSELLLKAILNPEGSEQGVTINTRRTVKELLD